MQRCLVSAWSNSGAISCIKWNRAKKGISGTVSCNACSNHITQTAATMPHISLIGHGFRFRPHDIWNFATNLIRTVFELGVWTFNWFINNQTFVIRCFYGTFSVHISLVFIVRQISKFTNFQSLKPTSY